MTMKAIHLQTEYLTNPLGIMKQNPLLMWNCEGAAKQTAFQICTEKWDSGKISSSSMRINYPKEIEPCERVAWKVRLWDENDKAGEWSEAFFEQGIDEWNAKWITANIKIDSHQHYPVDCFRKKFESDKICSARLYITACGVYEASINDKRVGNFYLAPGITDYRKRVQYQTYDITEMINEGENEIRVMLADGWYRGSVGAWGLRNQYGKETKFTAILVMTNIDGSVTTIITDDSWDWSNDGPIRFADNKDGEIVDSNLLPTFSNRAKVTTHKVRPCASNNVAVTEHEHLNAKKVITPSGKTVLDFGQNIAGIIKFRIKAQKGNVIKLYFGELIDKEGEFTQKNIQLSNKKKTTPLQRVIYTCKEGLNEYQTKFSIFGFQYVLVESDVEVNEDDYEAIAVYSDMEETSSFESSNELLNRFYKSTLWSARNNHADIPTDCPTRERHGWSGDAEIFCKSASFLFNYRSFAQKYVNDLKDGQHHNGNIGQIAPYGGVDFYMKTMDGSAGWSDAIVLIPWRIYTQYGDIEILKQSYSAMKRYADYKISKIGKWYLTAKPTGVGIRNARLICNYGQSYGEWAEPSDVCAFKISDFISPHPEETTAYIVFLMNHMESIANILNKGDDALRYANIARKVKFGYQKLVETKKYSLDTDRQAKQVRPLYMDLLNDKQKEYAQRRLIEALEHYGWRLGTGFLSTPFILDVLTDIDPEYAYKLLENEEIPGWLSMPKNGANTIWEAWEGPNSTQGGIGSLNHYSKGAVLEWVFTKMCGVNVDGENHFTIEPIAGGHFSFARLCYKSVYGEVISEWKMENGKINYYISVPANCSATFISENGKKELTYGEYRF